MLGCFPNEIYCHQSQAESQETQTILNKYFGHFEFVFYTELVDEEDTTLYIIQESAGNRKWVLDSSDPYITLDWDQWRSFKTTYDSNSALWQDITNPGGFPCAKYPHLDEQIPSITLKLQSAQPGGGSEEFFVPPAMFIKSSGATCFLMVKHLPFNSGKARILGLPFFNTFMVT